jgi:membrane protease YdiL (CAAX protease family)
VAKKLFTRNLTSDALTPVRAGLMAVCIAAVAYALAPTVSSALSFHAVRVAQSLIVAPVIEELFFRGFVQARLRARGGFWGRPWIAIGVTAACFGVAHLATASVAHAALVVAPAFVIGWVYERTRSIALCIALHSAANAIWIGYWSI